MTYQITKEDWKKYDWIPAEYKNGNAIKFIRGVKRVLPPDDGYHYVEITAYDDTEQKWIRAEAIE